MSRSVDVELFELELVFDEDGLFDEEGLDEDGLEEGEELELAVTGPSEASKAKTMSSN